MFAIKFKFILFMCSGLYLKTEFICDKTFINFLKQRNNIVEMRKHAYNF